MNTKMRADIEGWRVARARLMAEAEIDEGARRQLFAWLLGRAPEPGPPTWGPWG